MMYKIEAYVREEKFEDVKKALDDLNVNGLTVYQVMGCGIQRGYKEIVRGMEVDMQMQPKVKFSAKLMLHPKSPAAYAKLSRMLNFRYALPPAEYTLLFFPI